jgi:flagellar basal body-associated protein FliL
LGPGGGASRGSLTALWDKLASSSSTPLLIALVILILVLAVATIVTWRRKSQKIVATGSPAAATAQGPTLPSPSRWD